MREASSTAMAAHERVDACACPETPRAHASGGADRRGRRDAARDDPAVGRGARAPAEVPAAIVEVGALPQDALGVEVEALAREDRCVEAHAGAEARDGGACAVLD